MSNIVESLYRTTLNEMALGEMSLQNPARIIKSHISYSNKYSIQDVEKIVSKAFDDVYFHDNNAVKYSRAIKSISNILLSDFEADFEEYINMNEDDIDEFGTEEDAYKEIMGHYYKYVDIFNNFYNDCKIESKGSDDKNYIELRNSARYAYNNLDKGIKNFIKTYHPEWSDMLNFYK
jgi:hypothetical protein